MHTHTRGGGGGFMLEKKIWSSWPMAFLYSAVLDKIDQRKTGTYWSNRNPGQTSKSFRSVGASQSGIAHGHFLQWIERSGYHLNSATWLKSLRVCIGIESATCTDDSWKNTAKLKSSACEVIIVLVTVVHVPTCIPAMPSPESVVFSGQEANKLTFYNIDCSRIPLTAHVSFCVSFSFVGNSSHKVATVESLKLRPMLSKWWWNLKHIR